MASAYFTSPNTLEVTLTNGTVIALAVTRHATSRHLRLRYHPLKRTLILSAPKRASKQLISSFAAQNHAAITDYMSSMPDIIMIDANPELLILGQPYTSADDHDTSPYPPLPKRGRESCKRTIMRMTCDYITHYSNQLITEHDIFSTYAITAPRNVTMRDTVSRWGSCTHDGRLMFSWRLAFAPLSVLHYLVAHECAHLVHHDHSDAFWALNYHLHPESNDARDWLHHHGSSLFCYA